MKFLSPLVVAIWFLSFGNESLSSESDASRQSFDQSINAYQESLQNKEDQKALQQGIRAIKQGEAFLPDDDKELAKLTLSVARLMNQFSGSLEFSELTVNYAEQAVYRYKNVYGDKLIKLLTVYETLVKALNQKWLTLMQSEFQRLRGRSAFEQARTQHDLKMISIQKEIETLDAVGVPPSSIGLLYLSLSLHLETARLQVLKDAYDLYHQEFEASHPKTLAFRLAALVGIEGQMYLTAGYDEFMQEQYEEILNLTDGSERYYLVRFDAYKGLLKFWHKLTVVTWGQGATPYIGNFQSKFEDLYPEVISQARKSFSQTPYRRFEWISSPIRPNPMFTLTFEVSKDGKAENINAKPRDQSVLKQKKRLYMRAVNKAKEDLKDARFIPSFRNGLPAVEKKVVI